MLLLASKIALKPENLSSDLTAISLLLLSVVLLIVVSMEVQQTQMVGCDRSAFLLPQMVLLFVDCNFAFPVVFLFSFSSSLNF